MQVLSFPHVSEINTYMTPLLLFVYVLGGYMPSDVMYMPSDVMY